MSVVRHLAVPAALAAVFVWAPAAQANHSYSATYSGTHQQGSGVSFDVNADGTGITRIVIGPSSGTFPGGTCQFGESTTTGGTLPINNHAFSLGGPSSFFQFSGSFHAPQMAQGTFRHRTPDGCDTGNIPWTASTSTPPPAPPPGPAPGPGPGPGADTTPPTVGVSAPRSQRLGRGRIRIRVRCPDEACPETFVSGTLSVPGAAATFRLRGATLNLRQGASTPVVLRVPRGALAAAKRALARGQRVTARIRVRAMDQADNQTVVRRTVRLRR